MDRGMGTGQDGEPSGASPLRDASRREIRLKRLMAFFMQEIQDSRNPIRSDTDMPDHECGFLTKPETGYCAFCDSWGEAFEALSAEAAGLPEPAPGEGSPSHPSGPSQDSQEVREVVAEFLRETAIDWEMGDHHKPWKDLKEDNRDWWRLKADRLLSLLSQSPKGTAGADEEGEAHARPIPEAARIKLEEAQAEFQTAQGLSLESTQKVWRCIVMAKSFLGEAAVPSPTTAGATMGVTEYRYAMALRRISNGNDTATMREWALDALGEAVAPSAPKTGLRGAGAPGEAGARLVEIEASSTAQTAYNELLRITNRADDTYIRASVPESVAREIIFRINAFNGAPGDVGSAGGDKA